MEIGNPSTMRTACTIVYPTQRVGEPDNMTVYYLAGPMASYPDHNHPAFHDAAAQLRARGLHIICPAEYGNLVTGWQECMKRDIHALLWCDAVIVLPGWEQSRGATLEANLADSLCMPVFDLHVMLGDGIPLFLSPGTIRDAYNTMHPMGLIEHEVSRINS